jgi:hypothetical protein
VDAPVAEEEEVPDVDVPGLPFTQTGPSAQTKPEASTSIFAFFATN